MMFDAPLLAAGLLTMGIGAYGYKKVNYGKLDVSVVICRSKDKTG